MLPPRRCVINDPKPDTIPESLQKAAATPSARPAETASTEPASTASPTIATTNPTNHDHPQSALRNQTSQSGHLLRSTSGVDCRRAARWCVGVGVITVCVCVLCRAVGSPLWVWVGMLRVGCGWMSRLCVGVCSGSGNDRRRGHLPGGQLPAQGALHGGPRRASLAGIAPVTTAGRRQEPRRLPSRGLCRPTVPL